MIQANDGINQKKREKERETMIQSHGMKFNHFLNNLVSN